MKRIILAPMLISGYILYKVFPSTEKRTSLLLYQSCAGFKQHSEASWFHIVASRVFLFSLLIARLAQKSKEIGSRCYINWNLSVDVHSVWLEAMKSPQVGFCAAVYLHSRLG